MIIEQRYQKIIEKLKAGHRYQEKLENNDVTYLSSELKKDLTNDEVEKILCILNNTSSYHSELEEQIVDLLNKPLTDDLLIYTLNVSRKHIITARMRDGHRMQPNFIMTLDKLLEHKNPEVVEWTLRTIDEIGSQGVFFAQKLIKLRPGFFSLITNKHKRAVREIIEMLLRRWGLYGN